MSNKIIYTYNRTEPNNTYTYNRTEPKTIHTGSENFPWPKSSTEGTELETPRITSNHVKPKQILEHQIKSIKTANQSPLFDRYARNQINHIKN